MLKEALAHRMIFVEGKGGVGKTTVAEAIARATAASGLRTLLVTIDDPVAEPGQTVSLAPNLSRLNTEVTTAFEEYAGLKIGSPALVRVFLHNKLMRYLVRAAPGIRELILMGKIWYEMRRWDRVVVDMPATGHALTMFQSLSNWGNLFHGSTLAKDANNVLADLANPGIAAHVVVALPEEMPLVEGRELRDALLRLFPKAEVAMLVNRCLPGEAGPAAAAPSSLVATTVDEHFRTKKRFERENLAAWDGLAYESLPYLPPSPTIASELAPLLADRKGAA